MTAGFAALSDQPVGAPRDRVTCLLCGSYLNEDEDPHVLEVAHQVSITAECQHDDVSPSPHTALYVSASHERHEQIDGDRPARCVVADLPYCVVQFRRR